MQQTACPKIPEKLFDIKNKRLIGLGKGKIENWRVYNSNGHCKGNIAIMRELIYI